MKHKIENNADQQLAEPKSTSLKIRPLGRQLAVLVIILAVALASVPGVAFAETRSGGTIVVGAGETISEDLDAYGGTIIVHGTINGDLTAYGGTVIIERTGVITGDVAAFGGTVEIARGAEVSGNTEIGAGTAIIKGSIDGDAEVSARTITLGSGAAIGGGFAYDGDLTRRPGASVAGSATQTTDLDIGPGLGGFGAVPAWLLGIYAFFVNLALGAVLLFAFPMFSRDVADRVVGTPLKSGGVGLLALIGVPLALLVVALTVVGIPLSLLGLLLFGVVAWIAAIYGRFAVGTWLLSLTNVESRWAALLVGLLVVGLARLVPFVGGVVEFVVLLLGLGAITFGLRARRQGRRDTVEAEPASDTDASGGIRPV